VGWYRLAMPEALKRCRLLYVEDQPAGVEAVEQLIARRSELVLLRAANLDAGIKLARRARPEVILLNTDLPGIDAPAFMKLVRAHPAMQNTPILALGTNAAPEAMTKALEAGFFHYLIKPLKPEPFIEALEYALEFAAQERAEENQLLSRVPKQPSKESL
jgi:CheY-like chemotaxis protein